jgi:hypothetical protein
MSESEGGAARRVRLLIAAARRLADPLDPLGVLARRELPSATGLSPEGVELALTRYLETNPSDEEVASLVRSVPAVPRAQVLLSANVFVAAHRALALALAASEDVVVRPSRREPAMARLLDRAAPGTFQIVERLEPRPGDHVWAYGSDETLEAIAPNLPAGVALHSHGSGIGVVFVELPGDAAQDDVAALAEAVTDDVVVFDQRGCLSPRIVFAAAEPPFVRALAERLAKSLAAAAQRVPLGRLEEDEVADRVRYRDALLVTGTLFPAGESVVGADVVGRAVVVPPIGRNVHVMRMLEVRTVAAALGPVVAAVGVSGSESFVSSVRSAFPRARLSRPGAMQLPPFDGPVDRRS